MRTRKYSPIVFILLLASLLLGACAPQASPLVDEPTPVIVADPTEPVAQGKLPAGTPLADLVEALGAAGLQVVEAGPGEGGLLDNLDSQMLLVNGSDVFVYDFGSPEAAAAAVDRISPDGTTITGLDGSISSVHWIAIPHFWLHATFIVQYLGEDPAILAGMRSALGEPFAGGLVGAEAGDFSRAWREVRQAGTHVGFALPCWWEIDEMPAEGAIRSQVARSYDEAFFAANSEKGEWVGGIWPEGAYKLDFTLIEVADPAKDTLEAYRALVDPSLQVIQDAGELNLGAHPWLVIQTSSVLHPDEPVFRLYLYRLAANLLLAVAPYPQPAAPDSPVVQAILGSFAMSSEEAVLLPAFDPGPALSANSCAG